MNLPLTAHKFRTTKNKYKNLSKSGSKFYALFLLNKLHFFFYLQEISLCKPSATILPTITAAVTYVTWYRPSPWSQRTEASMAKKETAYSCTCRKVTAYRKSHPPLGMPLHSKNKNPIKKYFNAGGKLCRTLLTLQTAFISVSTRLVLSVAFTSTLHRMP